MNFLERNENIKNISKEKEVVKNNQIDNTELENTMPEVKKLTGQVEQQNGDNRR